MQSEKEDLQKRLKEKEELEAEQQTLIDQLRSKVIVSSTLREQTKENKVCLHSVFTHTRLLYTFCKENKVCLQYSHIHDYCIRFARRTRYVSNIHTYTTTVYILQGEQGMSPFNTHTYRTTVYVLQGE